MLIAKSKGRLFSIILVLAVAITFQFAGAQEVSAAAKAKRISLLTSASYEYKYDNGDIEKNDGPTFVYNKKGLLKTIKYENGYKEVYKRNKAGIVKSVVYYEGSKVRGKQINTIKKGKIVKSKYKAMDDSKGNHNFTITTEYKNGKKYKEITKYNKLTQYITWYHKNGNQKKTEQIFNGKVTGYTKYDSRGYTTYEKTSDEMENIETIKTNTYDKRGNLIKYTTKTTGKRKENNKDYNVDESYTETYKNKYDKKKNLVKTINQSDYSVTTYSYKYKTVKVPKNYRKLVEEEQRDLLGQYARVGY